MPNISLSSLREEYQRLWDTCQILPEWRDLANSTIGQILKNKPRYEGVASVIGCPWYFIAVIHNMESTLSFKCHLHNGDPLTGYTYHEPPNRPIKGSPPFTWEESAIDVLTMQEIDQVKDWSIPGLLFQAEQYNGWGYRLYHPEVLSPYLWSGTNHYRVGKYVSDGSFDPNYPSGQIGVVPLLKLLLPIAMSENNSKHQPIVQVSTLSKGGRTKIKTIEDCYFTLSPTNWQQLPKEQRGRVRAGTVFPVLCWREVDADYLVFTFDRVVLKGRNTWHVRKESILMAAAPKPIEKVPTPADGVVLKVPYLSQLDNELYPLGSCNVTSIAMALAYFGHPIRNTHGVQLEDELNQYCDRNGLDRHVPGDLAQIVKAYGYKDDFTPAARWADVKEWIDRGNPCVVHGWFTGSGHIICIIGYNPKGWVVNDPYGEWYSSGYDTTRSGAGLTYSYEMMRQICGMDGDLWIHYLRS